MSDHWGFGGVDTLLLMLPRPISMCPDWSPGSASKSSFLLMSTLAGSRGDLMKVSPCHPCGRLEFSALLLTSAWPSLDVAGLWENEMNGSFLPFCLSNK